MSSYDGNNATYDNVYNIAIIDDYVYWAGDAASNNRYIHRQSIYEDIADHAYMIIPTYTI